jgi:hypothetical protein
VAESPNDVRAYIGVRKVLADRRVLPIIILAVVLVSLYFTYQEKRDAARDRRAVATFIAADAASRAAGARDSATVASFFDGLSVHATTCKASCITEKFSAFLDAEARARRRQVARNLRVAELGAGVAKKLDPELCAIDCGPKPGQ